MAKRKTRNRKSRRLGSVITTRPLRLGKVDQPGTWLGAIVPPAVGGGIALASSVGIEALAQPSAGTAPTATHMWLQRNSAWLGIGVSTLVGLGAPMFGLRKATGASIFAGGLGVGGALLIKRWMDDTANSAATAGLRGRRTGAIVMDRVSNNGMGAVVAERSPVGPLGSVYQAHGPAAGAVVNMAGINSSAFGTSPFQASAN